MTSVVVAVFFALLRDFNLNFETYVLIQYASFPFPVSAVISATATVRSTIFRNKICDLIR